MSTAGLQRSLGARHIPDVLWKLLDPAEGAVDPPIRAEVFGRERFAQHGDSLARTHVARRSPSLRRGPFFPRLRANIQVLRFAHRFIADHARSGYHVSPAAEWLLDNFHLIEAQLKEILEGLPRRYFRDLPVLVDAPLAGLPRVYGVAWAFVAHTDAAFHEEMLEHFLEAYQRERPLTHGELWALPTTLRVVLVEDLRRLAERLAINKAARELANLVCDRLVQWDVELLDRLARALRVRGADRPFFVQMSYRLQDQRSAELAPVVDWLARSLPDVAEARVQQVADQAADNISVSNAIGSLRLIGDADWAEIIERTSPTMQLLLDSPMFVAERSDTRDATLHEIEQLARRCGQSELDIAQTLMTHVKTSADTSTRHWLQGAGRHDFLAELGLHERPIEWWHAIRHRLALPAYLLAQFAGTALLVAWWLSHRDPAAGPWWIVGAALAIFPASEAVVALVNRMISESKRPRPLPRLALAQGIPAEHRVLVVMPSMITSTSVVRSLAHRLELHYLANPEANAQFALLTDWRDAPSESMPDDESLLAAAVQRIRALNERYGVRDDQPPRFLLLHRRRVFSPTQQRYLGWERKRGKLEQLIDILADPSAAGRHQFVDLGELSRIAPSTPYVLTLDADTQLPPGRLRELVGVAAHPQNRPHVDPRTRTVVSGYGVLQPKVATLLPSSTETTIYHWLFAGQCGIDPYSAASSEVYQDVFCEGTFTGKGLLNVAAMQATLRGRLPDGEVLSHDLLEGALARCAAVTDVEVIEGSPFHADVAASRVHRWTRGDWQLLPFVLQPGRYPVRAVNRWKMIDNLRRSLVAPASLAWLVWALGTGNVDPWLAFALVAVAFAAGPLMGAVAGLAPSRDDIAKRHFYAHAGEELLRAVCSALWQLAQLLLLAISSVDAIGRALYRMAVSRRGLLDWTTAAAAEAAASTDLPRLVKAHAVVPLTAAALGAALIAAGTPHPLLVVATSVVWALSPLWTWWVSRPRPQPSDTAQTAAERDKLQAIARDTWRFFERAVSADDNHLPPDNLQVVPEPMLAHRTSPTNIGLYLLSAACARRFGWIGADELADRLEATLATLQRLPRHRGHFLNWYDTQSATALLPMYVSTVDSGNLSACLLAVANACRELAKEHPDGAARLNALAQRCDTLAWEPDFNFLYHRKRKLLHIGYRIAEQQLDASLYDLMASESRLTSLLAIAKGDVPVQHWSALGRPFYAVGTHAALRSWSGSMFEYLMPTLLLHEPRGSVLCDANLAAIDEQIAYGRERGVPWGISESAYAGSDYTLAYQYAPQGVPRLALRRTPLDELVIAPYATALATQLAPQRAMANLASLDEFRMRGRYGYFESLDFTPSRQSGSDRATRVETFMAHHQGMTVVAAANVLLDGAPRRWAMTTPRLEAVASLLHERAPREVSVLLEPPAGPPPDTSERRLPGMLRALVPGATAVSPTHLLSNGRYAVSLRANGAGWSQWGARAISRSRDDVLRDQHGCFCYVRRSGDDALASLTHHPAPDSRASYRASFQTDRVRFDTGWDDLRSQMTVWVSPEDDVEFREVELHNLGSEPIEMDLVIAFEPTLADPKADEAHPAFSNLFLRAAWRHRLQALTFERKPRLPTEPSAHAACFVAHAEPAIDGVRIEVQRARWAGRNRSAGGPLGEIADAAPGEDTVLDTGLDPMCAIAVRVRMEPGAVQRVVFGIAAADRAETLDAVIDKYRHPLPIERSSKMSATMTGIRLRELNLGVEHFAAIQDLTTALVTTLTRPAPAGSAGALVRPGACDRRTLWRFGVSGDRPIVLVSLSAPQAVAVIRALGQALRLWAWGGVACDLVVINAEPSSYQMPLQQNLASLRDQIASSPNANLMALHVLRDGELQPIELETLRALARLEFKADGRPLSHHVDEWLALHQAALARRDAESSSVLPIARGRAPGLRRPTGRFMNDGAFRFDVGVFQRPARPWVNVLANPSFGAQLSEAGGGYTWGGNSRMNQLTPWSNDPVCDTPGEWFLIEDLSTRNVWSVTPSIGADPSATYRVTHGQGASRIEHRRGDVVVDATWCVDPDADVKQIRIRLMNRGRRTQRLRVLGIAEWIMGAGRAQRATTVTACDTTSTAASTAASTERGRTLVLSCTQRDGAAGFGLGTAFLAMALGEDDEPDWTCDRRELFDERGRFVVRSAFALQSGAGLDPCAALSNVCTLRAGEETECVFLLGFASEPQEAVALASKSAQLAASQRQSRAIEHWNDWLGRAVVKTPDPLFDALVNRWLVYQTVACRMWARAGFYQAGGAFGYRDQLQDAMSLAWIAPAQLRRQIVLHASRQFVEGDVQHWWHAPDGAGVRTHFSDDLLWLPHACSHYVETTGDAGVLDEVVPFIEGPAVEPGAEDSYHVPTVSRQTASVYEHAARTIDRSLTRGAHGLPLMGSGDWNDGMNRVGAQGRGESVWLGWFLCKVVADFAPLAEARGEHERAARWRAAAEGWRKALLTQAWDGRWFKRAFFDDGSPLGSHVNAECRIDLIAQAWAVMSEVAPAKMQGAAMRSLDEELVDHDAGLLRLLTPPLQDAEPTAGYIQAYPPGVRENAGQYSHAGVWALIAQAMRGDADLAYRYFTYLSPAHRSADPRHADAYEIEPYVMAGDTYSVAPYVGRGGWSWYTGSAAWMHRAALEHVLGLRQRGETIEFAPRLPSHWAQAEITLRRGERVCRVLICRRDATAAIDAARRAGAQPREAGQAWRWDAQDAAEFVLLVIDPAPRAAAPAGAAPDDEARSLVASVRDAG